MYRQQSPAVLFLLLFENFVVQERLDLLEVTLDILMLFENAFANVWANADLFVIPALIYALVATGAALLLGWGRVFYEQVGDTFVLKLPGGGLLASMPIPELFLLGLVLSLEPIQAGAPLWGVGAFPDFLCHPAHLFCSRHTRPFFFGVDDGLRKQIKFFRGMHGRSVRARLAVRQLPALPRLRRRYVVNSGNLCTIRGASRFRRRCRWHLGLGALGGVLAPLSVLAGKIVCWQVW